MIIFLTTYPIGFFLLSRCGRRGGMEKRIGVDVAAGLVTACVFAQLFSLFYRVSWEALLLFATLSVVCTVLEKGKAFHNLFEACSRIKPWQWLVIAAAAVMVAYCNSVGAYLPDTDSYHAQAIRWIEEYGVVRGLGNAIRNTAYNSSFFPLTALYSMKYVFGRSLHTLQGFWALLALSQCTGFLGRFWKADFRLSDFARVGTVYYATLNYRAMISPSSDYAVMFPLFLIAIWYLESVEKREEDAFPFIVLCMIGCNCVTTKLSAGVILLLSICPIVMLIRKRQIKPIVYSVLTALLIVVPYLIRNVIISGWLIYPSTALDLFDVPWKMPAQIGEADAYQIHVWGWDVHGDPEMEAASLISWIPHWFSSVLSSTEKLLVLASLLISLITVFVLLIQAVRYLFLRKTRSEKTEGEAASSEKGRLLLLFVTFAIEYFFWQYSAPLPRYGYAYLILLPLLGAGIALRWMKKVLQNRGMEKLVRAVALVWCLAVMAFVGKKVLVVLQYYPQTYLAIDYIAPQDYLYHDGNAETAEKRIFEVDGVRFYYLSDAAYHPLPVSGVCIGLLGEDIKDGFCYVGRREEEIHWIQ